jgi:hypothetical protein
MNGSTPKRSPWGKTCSGTVTLGDYGTFFSPERRARGFWRLQTDYQPLIDMMKKRCWDKKSPWKMTGWGTSYIFRRSFHGTYEAERSFERILQKLEAKDCSHVKPSSVDSEALPIPRHQPESESPFSESTPQKVPPLTGENSGSSSLYSEKKEEI